MMGSLFNDSEIRYSLTWAPGAQAFLTLSQFAYRGDLEEHWGLRFLLGVYQCSSYYNKLLL